MNIQRHERIKQISKLSGYLRASLKFFEILIWMAFPIIVTFFLETNHMALKIGDQLAAPGDVTSPQRLYMVAVVSIKILLTLMAVRYTRRLMEAFSEGKVFDVAAIRIARKAVNSVLALFALQILFEVGGSIYTGKIEVPGPALTVFYGFLMFGLLQIMLWALEVGRDLRDESELTI